MLQPAGSWSRGTVPLKGKAEPLEVFAPLTRADDLSTASSDR